MKSIVYLEFYNRFPGRQALLEYAAQSGIPVTQTTAKPWSTDENLFHISYEAGILEDPNTTPPADMWKLTTAPENAPNDPERITIEFKAGLPVRVVVPAAAKEYTDAVEIFDALNALGRKHGIGRIDIVENRFIGVKSRGCYETPGATILRTAHIDLEGLTLDRNVRALRDQFTTIEFSRILYNGHFFTPEREFVTSSIPTSQRTVNGLVRLKLYKGNVVVEGRESSEVSSYQVLEKNLFSKHLIFRVSMMSNNPPWTSLVASSPLTQLVSLLLSPSGSKSM
jgi:argininosuccinate synthase